MKLTIGNYTIEGTAQEVHQILQLEQSAQTQDETPTVERRRTRSGRFCTIRDNSGNSYMLNSYSEATRWLAYRGLGISPTTISDKIKTDGECHIGKYTIVATTNESRP